MPRWSLDRLCQKAKEWFVVTRKQKITASEKSPWWNFAFEFPHTLTLWVTCFVEGSHGFSPLKTYRFPDEVVQVWEYCDKLFVHLIYGILKPTFKAVISKRCYHLKGPSVIRFITQQIKRVLASGEYEYAIRLDIKSYFASIDHDILLQQIEAAYDDPLLKKYLRDIITIGIDRDGLIDLPHKGIPIRSSLSPFFGALYLKPLDEAFETREGVAYWRYMDDVIILFKTQRQYQRAKKQIFKILRELRLKLSPHKTKMGKLDKPFHFLGVTFGVARTHQSKTQLVTIDIHDRCCRRALDKCYTHSISACGATRAKTSSGVYIRYMSCESSAQQSHRLKGEGYIALKESAVNPAEIKRYLIRWASWWNHVVGKDRFHFIGRWIDYTAQVGAGFELISHSFLISHNQLRPPAVRLSNESLLIQAVEGR